MERLLPSGRKGSARYLYWREAVETWQRGSSILLFQHFAREKRNEFTRGLLDKVGSRTGSPSVLAIRTANVLFLVACHTDHEAMLLHAVRLVETRWSDQVRIEWLPKESDSLPADRYSISIFWSEEDDCYVADIPDLKSCSAFGDSPEEALAEVQIAEKLWLEVASNGGTPIPPPSYRPAAIVLASEANKVDRL